MNKRSDTHWVKRRFDRITPYYPWIERLLLVPQNARRRAVEGLQLGVGGHVLVVGCGRGPSLEALSKLVGPEGSVVGLDLSGKMLQRAQRIVEQKALSNVELLQQNLFQHTPEEPVDAVLFEFSLSSFGDPHRGLKHTWSHLKVGGRMVVLDGQLPPRLRWLTRPLMPLIRWTLERTVLGDPDMRPIEALEQLGSEVHLEWFRRRTYFVAQLLKSQ